MAAKYTYPKDIETSKYEYRHIKIFVKESEVAANSKAAYESALKKFDSAVKQASKEAESASEMKANLDENNRADDSPTKSVIVLPLPNTFTDTQNHGWSTESGIIGTLGQGLMNMSPTGLAAKVTQPLRATGGVGQTLNNAANAANDIAGNITLDKVLGSSSSAMGLRKPLIDPGYFQNYSGSDPREFMMNWDLVPASASEANEIFMIIMKLKEYSSPTSTVKGVSLLAPYFFSIEFGNPFIKAMAKIDRVVIKNISIDYGADGFMQQTFDGMPKHMALTITFAEVDMSTADDYRKQR